MWALRGQRQIPPQRSRERTAMGAEGPLGSWDLDVIWTSGTGQEGLRYTVTLRESPQLDFQFPHTLRPYPGCLSGAVKMEQNDIVAPDSGSPLYPLPGPITSPHFPATFVQSPGEHEPCIATRSAAYCDQGCSWICAGPWLKVPGTNNSAVRRAHGTCIICC